MNSKGADQPVHLCPLVSIFVIPYRESHESGLVHLLQEQFHCSSLSFGAEEAGLMLSWLKTPKTGFLASRPIYEDASCS